MQFHKGLVFLLTEEDIAVVLVEPLGNERWNCTVIYNGNADSKYPVDGFNIVLWEEDLQDAEQALLIDMGKLLKR